MKLRSGILAILIFASPIVGLSQQSDCAVFGRASDLPQLRDDCPSVDYENESAHLEALFAQESADAFVSVREVSGLPGEVHSMLMDSVPFGNVAEWGEDWNAGDIASQERPMAQHVISFTSDRVSLVIFRSGGSSGPVTNVLLAATSFPAYCVFRYMGNDIPEMLTLSSLRAAAKHQRLSEADSTCHARADLNPLPR